MTVADCGVPADADRVDAGPAVFVSAKTAGVIPGFAAVTLKLPAVVLAVNAGAVAIPDAFVVIVADPLNVPLAPVTGAVNVTITPLTGLPKESVTTTCRAVA